MIILGLTGVAAFLTSAVLLRIGMTPMVVRYPVAIAAAYGVFIMLIGLWLWMQRQEPDMDDLTEGVLDGALRNVDMTSAGGGSRQFADISGGGWDAGAPAPVSLPSVRGPKGISP